MNEKNLHNCKELEDEEEAERARNKEGRQSTRRQRKYENVSGTLRIKVIK